MSDRKKKKHDTRTVLSNEQIKILEIEYQPSKFISFERQKELAEQFNVKVYLITGWFLERRSNDQDEAREKTELGPNSINLNEYASSSSSLFTTATPAAGLQSVDFRLTASPAAQATSSGSNDFCYDLHYPHVRGNFPNDTYLPSHHNMTFLSLDGVGPTSVTSQGNISRSGQAAVAEPTLTSSQQNTTIQPQSSNQQGVLLKKEVQHCPDYNDFEKRKSVILSHLKSFTSKELITKKKALEGEYVLYHRRYLWMSLCYLTVFNCLG
ncbi:unnamed protein product [Clavelina lepadiformis]|uniref:Homeobox domain-containing protein n=1 Tax=Clavelina lepadiformis TaxID=159417 RepID=A0ABP0FQF9_CLALP